MGARPGDWSLLGQSSDPVAGDPDRLNDLISYYTKIADTIQTEGDTLQRIGDGDTSQLKGESADAIRKRSTDVAKSLHQVSGRYSAVRDALTGYGPQLDQARDESLAALNDAMAASDAASRAASMPNPATDLPPADQPQPTADQLAEQDAQRHAHDTAVQNASDDTSAARHRLDNALAALNDAGRSAANVIRAAWDDGLVDTLGYKIAEAFKRFLKILVKVLMWIGVALSVLAFFVPGLGALALAGAAVAVMSLAASTALAAMGEGSWLDVILGAVSVLMLGAGALIAKVVQNMHIGDLVKIGTQTAKVSGKAGQDLDKIVVSATKVRAGIMDDFLKGNSSVEEAMARIASVGKLEDVAKKAMPIVKYDKIMSDFKVKPQWWNIGHPDYLKNDIGKITDVFVKGDWKLDRLLSIDRAGKLADLRTTMRTLDIPVTPVPTWAFANGGRVVYGWANTIFKLGTTPTGVNGDDSRWGAYEDGKAGLVHGL